MGKQSDLCVVCEKDLLEAGYLRQPGKKYQVVYYCDQLECARYGLVSLYKLRTPTNRDKEV